MKTYVIELTGLVHNRVKNQWFNPEYAPQDYREWLADGNTPDIEEPVVDPSIAIKTQERMALENKYLQCSRQICLWAGDQLEDDVYPKLNNIDFENKSQLAVSNMKEEANRIITTMTWCLFDLQMNHNWAWENIEYRGNL